MGNSLQPAKETGITLRQGPVATRIKGAPHSALEPSGDLAVGALLVIFLVGVDAAAIDPLTAKHLCPGFGVDQGLLIAHLDRVYTLPKHQLCLLGGE